MLHEGQLGVHPPGALGVAFFIHAHAECFVGRGDDGITQPLKDAGRLNLDEDGRLRTIPLADRIFANLLEADARESMPELLLVCCNPDQLHLFTRELTRYLESLAERGRLRTLEEGRDVVDRSDVRESTRRREGCVPVSGGHVEDALASTEVDRLAQELADDL